MYFVSWCPCMSTTGVELTESRLSTGQRLITTLCRTISVTSAACSINSTPALDTITPDSALSSCTRKLAGRPTVLGRRCAVAMVVVTVCRRAERATLPASCQRRQGSVDRWCHPPPTANRSQPGRCLPWARPSRMGRPPSRRRRLRSGRMAKNRRHVLPSTMLPLPLFQTTPKSATHRRSWIQMVWTVRSGRFWFQTDLTMTRWCPSNQRGGQLPALLPRHS